jgi:hypothetical protein
VALLGPFKALKIRYPNIQHQIKPREAIKVQQVRSRSELFCAALVWNNLFELKEAVNCMKSMEKEQRAESVKVESESRGEKF